MIKVKKKVYYRVKKKIKKLKKRFFEKILKKKKLTGAEQHTACIIKKGRRFFRKINTLKKKKIQKLTNFLRKKADYSIFIKILPNNIFCVLKNNIKNKTIVLISAGILKLKITKKKLKFVNKILINKFINRIKKKLKKKRCIIKISGPKKIRSFIVRNFIFALKKSTILINALEKKVFNGCRAKKIRRKKRKGFRIFK